MYTSDGTTEIIIMRFCFGFLHVSSILYFLLLLWCSFIFIVILFVNVLCICSLIILKQKQKNYIQIRLGWKIVGKSKRNCYFLHLDLSQTACLSWALHIISVDQFSFFFNSSYLASFSFFSIVICTTHKKVCNPNALCTWTIYIIIIFYWRFSTLRVFLSCKFFSLFNILNPIYLKFTFTSFTFVKIYLVFYNVPFFGHEWSW